MTLLLQLLVFVMFLQKTIGNLFLLFVDIFLDVLVGKNIDVVMKSVSDRLTTFLIRITLVTILCYQYYNKSIGLFIFSQQSRRFIRSFLMAIPGYFWDIIFYPFKTPGSILSPGVFTISERKLTFKYSRHLFSILVHTPTYVFQKVYTHS